MLAKIERIKAKDIVYRRVKADAKQFVNDLERIRNLERTWFHIDMDMFYAAVEIRDRPELAEVPVAIGDMMMIATSNYVARKFGVRSAMPGYIGVQLCPELMLIPPNYQKYQAVSKIFRDIVAEYDPEFVSLGLDEVNMDVTDFLIANDINNEEGKQELAQRIRTRVFESTRLTCSAGIAPNRMLAKICSDWNKPNGQAYIAPNQVEILDFIGKLDIRKIPYIGAMTETTLKELGILKGRDLVEKAADLMIAYREIMYTFLIKCGLGIGQQVHHEEKSDETFV